MPTNSVKALKAMCYTLTFAYQNHKCRDNLRNSCFVNYLITRMWVQCPTWWSPCRTQVAPSVQHCKVWLTPTTRCRAVTLPRRETHWNLQGCLKLPDGSQPLVGRSSPYCGDMWRTYRCLTSFFPIVDTCLSCEDIARRSCAMVPRWRFLATFFRPYFHTRCGLSADLRCRSETCCMPLAGNASCISSEPRWILRQRAKWLITLVLLQLFASKTTTTLLHYTRLMVFFPEQSG